MRRNRHLLQHVRYAKVPYAEWDQRTALQGIRHYTDRATRTGMHGIRDMHEIHAIQQTHANRKATAYRPVADHIPSQQPAEPYLAASVILHHQYSVAALNQLRHPAHNHSPTTGGSNSRLSTVGHWSANPAPCNSASTYGNRKSRICRTTTSSYAYDARYQLWPPTE